MGAMFTEQLFIVNCLYLLSNHLLCLPVGGGGAWVVIGGGGAWVVTGGGGAWVVTGGGGAWVVTGGGGAWVVTGGGGTWVGGRVAPPSSLNAYSEYR